MFFYSDDPVRDAERYWDYMDKQVILNCPVCEVCGEPIEDEYSYNFDEDWVHEDCLSEYFKKERRRTPYGNL